MKYTDRSEVDVGISHRIGSHPRFFAKVKERYSDFHVNEIDEGGQIVKLTSLELPIESSEQIALNDPEVIGLVPDELRAEVGALAKALEDKAERKEALNNSVSIPVTSLDKGDRTKIHKWISSAFDKLSSQTVNGNGAEKFIKVVALTGKLKQLRRPANRAKYTHCILYKEGMTTGEAVGLIAKKLNLNPGLISVAGMKDKRAKTTQRICISNVEASRLLSVAKQCKGFQLGNFSYQPKSIALGELKGNHFKLLLKNMRLENSENGSNLEQLVEEAVCSLKTSGFVNYYGLQRFGTYETATHVVGKEIFKQNWIQAFDLILAPKPNDVPAMKKAKDSWLKLRKPEESASALSHNYSRSIESHLITGLSEFYWKNDLLNALLKIPRNSRLLYAHAFQSWIWNRTASFRLKEYGMTPVVGDLVYAVDKTGGEMLEEAVELDEDFGKVENSPNLLKNPKLPVKILTEEDIKSGHYSIFDVLVPLYGSDVQYPENKVSDHLKSMLKEEGIDEDCFKKFRPVGDKPTGAYRRVVVLPKNVEYKILSYSDSDPLDSFIPSDLDILQNSTGPVEDDKVGKTAAEPKKKCLVLEFSLPSSSYATMALREIILEEKIPKDNESCSEPEPKRLKIEEKVDNGQDDAKCAEILN